METVLEMLRKKNPGLPLYSVTDPEFKRYGRILAGETGELAQALPRIRAGAGASQPHEGHETRGLRRYAD